jgi:hypothetical protein
MTRQELQTKLEKLCLAYHHSVISDKPLAFNPDQKEFSEYKKIKDEILAAVCESK